MRLIFGRYNKVIYSILLNFIFSVVSFSAMAQPPASTEEEKLTPEEQTISELNAAEAPAQPSSLQKRKVKPDEIEIIESQGAMKSIVDEDTIEVYEIPPDAISEMEFEAGSRQVRYIDQEYLTNGLSFGATMFNHNYNVVANLLLNNNFPFDASKKTADFQSAGAVLRYAILPYDKIGTDVNLTVASTLNHLNLNSTAIASAKAEINLGYSIQAGGLPIYMLAGLGSEILTGKDIEALVAKTGTGFQVGGGVGLGKKFQFEFMYTYMRHPISDQYLANVANIALANGAVSAKYDNNEANATSNILTGRVIYSY